MKSVLITGGAGFLGSHLANRFLNEGYKVVALDNLCTGREVNIAPLNNNPEFTFINHDICDSLEKLNLPKFDIICNLACPASPPHYQKDPIFTWKTSTIGVYNLLEKAIADKSLFFQASTSEVYGNPLEHPQNEDYWGNVNCTGIRSCYDEGKRAAESLIFDVNRMHGLPVKVVRIFNTYGPNMDPLDGRVVTNFILQALKGEDLTVYGDGLQTRSYCYVDDLIDGFMKMIFSPAEVLGPINLGNPTEYTVKETAEIIKETVKSGSKLIFKELPSDDPLQRKPNITRAKEILNWEPKVSFKEGLQKTIEYYTNNLKNEE